MLTLGVEAGGAPELVVVDGVEDEVTLAVEEGVRLVVVAGAFVLVGLAVPLDLVVALRSPAALDVPVSGGGKRVGRAVELVGPDEMIGLGVGEWGEDQEDQRRAKNAHRSEVDQVEEDCARKGQ